MEPLRISLLEGVVRPVLDEGEDWRYYLDRDRLWIIVMVDLPGPIYSANGVYVSVVEDTQDVLLHSMIASVPETKRFVVNRLVTELSARYAPCHWFVSEGLIIMDNLINLDTEERRTVFKEAFEFFVDALLDAVERFRTALEWDASAQ